MDRTWQKFEYGVEVDSGVHEVSWEHVRANRNQALSACDWRALKDVTLSTAWGQYRDLLRTLPQRFADAGDACDNWPVMPDE